MKPFLNRYFLLTHGSFPVDAVELVDEYLASIGVWGGSQKDAAPTFSLKLFYASIIQKFKIRPSELAEMTLTEALLYTINLEDKKAGVTMKEAVQKVKVMKSLPIDQYLELARLRSMGD